MTTIIDRLWTWAQVRSLDADRLRAEIAADNRAALMPLTLASRRDASNTVPVRRRRRVAAGHATHEQRGHE